MYIQDIPKDSKFWVVRSGDGGMFYDHFVHNSIAAIGHIDAMEFSDQTLSNKDEVIKLVYNYKQTLLEKRKHLHLHLIKQAKFYVSLMKCQSVI